MTDKNLAIRLYLASREMRERDWVEIVIEFFPQLGELDYKGQMEVLQQYRELKDGLVKVLVVNTPVEVDEKKLEELRSNVERKLKMENLKVYQNVDKTRDNIKMYLDDKEIIVNI